MTPLAALTLAAQLMHQPVPQGIEVYWPKTFQRLPTAQECNGARPFCYAMTALAGKTWIIIAPADAPALKLVHEACHVIQTIREGHSIKGRKAEAECERVERLAASQALVTP